jgi:hypothetical protein
MPETKKKTQKEIKAGHRDLKPRQDAKGGGGPPHGGEASRPQGGPGGIKPSYGIGYDR